MNAVVLPARDNVEPAAATVHLRHWNDGEFYAAADSVVVEEPLEIRIHGEALTVTMRTPGADLALAAGLLLSEGIVRDPDEIISIAHCSDPESEANNVVNVFLSTNYDALDSRWSRRFASTSSCGLCGKTSLDAVRSLSFPPASPHIKVSPTVVSGLPDAMRAAQRTFQRTGGLHAAGLFDASGELLGLHEDVGRHNAVDKLLGGEFLAGRTPLHDRILLVSGRTSFEIVQKAAAAGIPILCAVSAPSSLAIELAAAQNITLVGFLRGQSMNVYSVPNRIAV
jgi:FdhD protein